MDRRLSVFVPSMTDPGDIFLILQFYMIWILLLHVKDYFWSRLESSDLSGEKFWMINHAKVRTWTDVCPCYIPSISDSPGIFLVK